MTPTDLAQRIDHTLLKPEATWEEIRHFANEAKEHGVAAACVAPVWVSRVVALLHGSTTHACTVVGFPHGTSKSTVKAIEATVAIKDGAAEVDVVMHLPNLIEANLDAARLELIDITRAARAARRDVVLKAILETAALLTFGTDRGEAAIATGCRAAREAGFDFVKTSTGFHPAGGASVQAVHLLKKYGEALKIKASGGIRDWATARQMLDAGADRLGTSNSVAILGEIR